MRLRHSVALATILLPAPLQAATLRPMTTLHAPVVKLSDLFDDAGALAARVLGPAPPPGEHIVVEAPQLAAIARMFGVAWHPDSPADRAVLERAGKLLPRESVLAALRGALASAGGPDDGDIELPGFESPMIPQDATPDLAVEQFDYDAPSGRFTTSLLLRCDAVPPRRLRIEGRVQAMAETVVAVRRLPAGTQLAADDLRVVRLPAAALRAAAARDPAQAAGLVLRHPVAAGQPLLLSELARPGTVAQGAAVVMQIQVGGLTATAQGVALADGAPGEHIQVLNPVSHMVVEGEVLASGGVLVAPGSLPLPAGPQALARLTNARVVSQ